MSPGRKDPDFDQFGGTRMWNFTGGGGRVVTDADDCDLHSGDGMPRLIADDTCHIHGLVPSENSVPIESIDVIRSKPVGCALLC